ncbi:MAG: hypothetical protein DRP85_03140 [Candidatus Makaraimicrobium thalassicum]|nr:MAG: hypothetical protein DRP85_03140 [Candidatus Omnitrophota bacterium]
MSNNNEKTSPKEREIHSQVVEEARETSLAGEDSSEEFEEVLSNETKACQAYEEISRMQSANADDLDQSCEETMKKAFANFVKAKEHTHIMVLTQIREYIAGKLFEPEIHKDMVKLIQEIDLIFINYRHKKHTLFSILRIYAILDRRFPTNGILTEDIRHDILGVISVSDVMENTGYWGK